MGNLHGAAGSAHVGPQSAGAVPGPACYGRGGTQPTVTDADLVHRGRVDVPLEPFVLTLSVRETLLGIERIASDLVFDSCIGTCLRDGQPLATSVGAPTFRVALAMVTP